MPFDYLDKGSYPLHQTTVPKAGLTEINVALFPYVPNMAPFKNYLQQMWSQKYPTVSLNFIDYDCYQGDPPPNLEVFAFDTIYLSDFISKNYLLSIPANVVQNISDFMTYALTSCMNGAVIYALPSDAPTCCSTGKATPRWIRSKRSLTSTN